MNLSARLLLVQEGFHAMGWASVVGCALVVGSALWIVLGKKKDVAAETQRIRSAAGDLEIGHAAAAAPGGEDVPMFLDIEEEEVDERNVTGRGDVVEFEAGIGIDGPHV
jgi:hypothetical protein